MADKYYNPFQAMEVRVLDEHREDFARYCQTASEGGRKSRVERSPFPRMIDLWFLGLCVAVRLGLTPLDLRKLKAYKLIEGTIFSSDLWRIDALMMLAIGYTGRMDLLIQPREVMNLANGLAAAGVSHVIGMLQDGDLDPIWNLSDSIEHLIKKGSISQ